MNIFSILSYVAFTVFLSFPKKYQLLGWNNWFQVFNILQLFSSFWIDWTESVEFRCLAISSKWLLFENSENIYFVKISFIDHLNMFFICSVWRVIFGQYKCKIFVLLFFLIWDRCNTVVHICLRFRKFFHNEFLLMDGFN